MARLPEGALMQRAAAGLATAIVDFLGSAYGRRVLLLVGSGDNGGDALWAGAMLARRGVHVEAWLLSDKAHDGGRAALRRAGGRVVDRAERDGPRWSSTGSSGSAVAAGCGRTPRDALKLLHGVPVVAVDTPSGVDVDTGEVDGRPRRGGADRHLRHPQGLPPRRPGGRWRAARCTSSTSGSSCPRRRSRRSSRRTSRRCCRGRRPTRQKYTRGVVGVRAGSAQYPGAALLSVAGAACGLAGMVRYVGDDAGRGHGPRRSTPRWSATGRVQAWVVGSGGGDARRRRSWRRRWRTASRSSSTPTRSSTSTARPGRGAHPARRRARRDARRGAGRRRGPAAALRARGGREVRRHGPAQGSPHRRRPSRRQGPGQHHRHRLARHRRRRRRAGRRDRRAARRRPHAVRRRERRRLAARRGRDAGLGRWPRSWPARSPPRCPTSCAELLS